MENNNNNQQLRDTGRRKPTFFIIIACLLGLVIIGGAVLGTVVAVKNARSLVSFEGTGIEEGALRYIAFCYKYEFMQKHKIPSYDDTEYFWQTEFEYSGKTFGEVLNEATVARLTSVAVGAYLFDRNTSLEKSEKEGIERAITDKINSVAGGDEGSFAELLSEYGFDIDGMRDGLTLLYKWRRAREVIYGNGGTGLSGAGYEAEREEFLETYTHVRLLFVSTEHRYVKNEQGSYDEFDLDPEQRAEAYSDIERLKELTDAYKTDAEEQISVAAFKSYENKYLFIPEFIEGGYYFWADEENYAYSEYSADFEARYQGVVSTALQMKNDSFSYLDWEEGVCFIYKYKVDAGAYAETVNEDFFGDFYDNASYYFYNKSIAALVGGAEVKASVSEMDFSALPFSFELYVNV